MSTPVPEWVRWAMTHTRVMRNLVRENCYPFHNWPIIVKDFCTFLPLDTLPDKWLTPLNDP